MADTGAALHCVCLTWGRTSAGVRASCETALQGTGSPVHCDCPRQWSYLAERRQHYWIRDYIRAGESAARPGSKNSDHRQSPHWDRLDRQRSPDCAHNALVIREVPKVSGPGSSAEECESLLGARGVHAPGIRVSGVSTFSGATT